jgi:hypothetical protein
MLWLLPLLDHPIRISSASEGTLDPPPPMLNLMHKAGGARIADRLA